MESCHQSCVTSNTSTAELLVHQPGSSYLLSLLLFLLERMQRTQTVTMTPARRESPSPTVRNIQAWALIISTEHLCKLHPSQSQTQSHFNVSKWIFSVVQLLFFIELFYSIYRIEEESCLNRIAMERGFTLRCKDSIYMTILSPPPTLSSNFKPGKLFVSFSYNYSRTPRKGSFPLSFIQSLLIRHSVLRRTIMNCMYTLRWNKLP